MDKNLTVQEIKEAIHENETIAIRYAGHGINLGGESPLWGCSSQPPTTSRSQGCPS